MNIIERVQKVLTDLTILDDFNKVHIDYTDNSKYDECGLSSLGESEPKVNISDTKRWHQHNFVLYSYQKSITDADRIANSSLLLSLGYDLSTLKGQEVIATINGSDYVGRITKMWASNAMVYAVDDPQKGILYQINLFVQYELERE